MSENVKRWKAPCCERHNRHVEVVLAADFDALLAENARLRDAGEGLAKALDDALDEFLYASSYKGEYLAHKHGDAEIADGYRVALSAWREAVGG